MKDSLIEQMYSDLQQEGIYAELYNELRPKIDKVVGELKEAALPGRKHEVEDIAMEMFCVAEKFAFVVGFKYAMQLQQESNTPKIIK